MKKFFKSRKKVVWSIIGLVVLAFVGYQIFKPKAGAVVGTIQKGEVKETLTLSGEVASDQDAVLQFQSAGKIAWVAVKVGQFVNKGKGLMGLDALILNSAYETTLNNYRSTQATVQKIHDDVKDHSADESFAQKQVRTAAEVANDNAYEAVKIAKKNLDESVLISPITGVVTMVTNPVAGINVTPGVPQVEILNPSSVYLSVTADQNDVVSLKIGDLAAITLDAYSDSTVSGQVTSISMSPKVGETSTVYEVKLALTGGQDTIVYKVGMTADADFVVNDKKDVLYVDPKFIKEDTKGKYLLVGVKKEKVYVVTGIESANQVEVSGNIQEGQSVSG